MINIIDTVDVTREKLRILEQTYEETRSEPSGDTHSRELTLRSLKSLINQLKEELVRHESRAGRGAGAS
jgi:hypothetical protein